MPKENRANILIVDDRPENLIALSSVLEELGQNIVQARSGDEALRHLLGEDFAVILLDVQMPYMDGFETASLIRSRPKTQHVPIIFLTAVNKTSRHVSHGYALGAVDYVFKPFDPVILRAKVAAFVELDRKTRALEAEVDRRQQAEQEVRRLNLELERRVLERTAQLATANDELAREVEVRKLAEQEAKSKQARIEALNRRLRQAMTETHHRVKNNLQIIAAILDMRAMDGCDFISVNELQRLGTQVRTLAAVHDILTQEAKDDGQAHAVSAKEILEKLLPMLQSAALHRRISYVLADTRLSARQATSLALVVNELVGNALKHTAGEVRVKLLSDGTNAVLAVEDDGPGFPPGFNPDQSAHTGLELVQHLSRWDLGGDTSFGRGDEGGGRVQVRIPTGALDSPLGDQALAVVS